MDAIVALSKYTLRASSNEPEPTLWCCITVSYVVLEPADLNEPTKVDLWHSVFFGDDGTGKADIMGEIRISFETTRTVEECRSLFTEAIKDSYKGGRKLMKVAAGIGGKAVSGVTFFDPPTSKKGDPGRTPALKYGAIVPGMSKMSGAIEMAVHIYVVEMSSVRRVELVGPYDLGEKGSTKRLVEHVASRLR